MTHRGSGWVLHAGSALDAWEGLATLDDLSVDCTITDPPYEAEAHEKGKRQGKPSGAGVEERGKKYERTVDKGFAFGAMTELDRQIVSTSIARVTRKWAGIFCQVEAVHLWRREMEAAGMIYRRCIPWVKPDAMPSLHGKWPGQSFEAFVIFGRVGVTAPVGGKARFYSHVRSRGDARAHDTAKPFKLMRDIVEDFTESGDLVLDPYAGSGTTGVACMALGRRFVGWELLDGTIPVERIVDGATVIEFPNYVEIAVRRLSGQKAIVKASQSELVFVKE